jgi:hypothetical protein
LVDGGDAIDKEGDVVDMIGVTVDDGILVCGETTDEEGETVNITGVT